VKTFKRHLTVANVLSCIALFVALSATAVAATKLGTGQVKAVNIANEAVTSPKIKNLAVTNSKLGKESITNGKIKKLAVTNPKLGKESVTNGKIKKEAVSEAKLGKEAVGRAKIGFEAVDSSKISSSLYGQLVRNVSYFSAESASNNAVAKSAEVSCPAGKSAIAGGGRVNGELSDVALTGSNPASSGSARTGWQAYGRDVEPGTTAGIWSVTAFVVCAEL
jgi:hypothetical protein